MNSVNITQVKEYLLELQARLCTGLAQADGQQGFVTDQWDRGGGGGITRVIENGAVFEKGGVNFSHVTGTQLPVSATAHRPDLAGSQFEAMGVSLVMHPLNPYAPTSHMNVRFFSAQKPDEAPVWWFGGGYDLTPYYGFDDDCAHWHRTAQQACAPFDDALYPRLKQWCDDYFFIKHRNEPRGIGGLFFDDFSEGGFENAFAFMRSVGDSYLPAYLPIIKRRAQMPWSDEQKQFQLYRRGRYVEFNLVYDRGTLFGLQTGGRTESILMSLPPLVRWDYNAQPTAGSEEERLYTHFLHARDWCGL